MTPPTFREVRIRVTISTPLFEASEELAARLGLSRSQLYAEALEHLVGLEPDEQVTARLNEVYTGEDSGLDAVLAAAQVRVLRGGY